MKGKRLFYNTLIMTVTSILLRTAGLLFQIYISKKMGASGVGLYYLVLSVNMFAATVAISGSRFATTRLISEEIGKRKENSVRKAVKVCLIYALFFGLFASAALYFSADFIGTKLIKDGRTVLSLHLLAISLPFLSAGAVLGGYFTGVSRVSRSAVGAVSEQIFKVAISAILLSFTPENNTEMMCASVVIGGVLGEILSFFVIFALYIKDRKRYQKGNGEPGIIRRMLGISLPLAASAYARTALSMAQNLLVPQGLHKSGRSAETALADYGTIQGMVFPIITFPSVLFASISELMVPELTEEQMQGRSQRITSVSNRILHLCLVFSVGVMGALFCFADVLGEVIYSNSDVGRYIKLLSFLMPVMYLDSVTDGMLRGLGEHMYSMKINIIDSLLSTALVYLLLPKFAVYGYIYILYASEIFNYIYSMKKLKNRALVEIGTPVILKAIFSAFASVNITELIIRAAGIEHPVYILTFGMTFFIFVYFVLSSIFGVINLKESVKIKQSIFM